MIKNFNLSGNFNFPKEKHLIYKFDKPEIKNESSKLPSSEGLDLENIPTNQIKKTIDKGGEITASAIEKNRFPRNTGLPKDLEDSVFDMINGLKKIDPNNKRIDQLYEYAKTWGSIYEQHKDELGTYTKVSDEIIKYLVEGENIIAEGKFPDYIDFSDSEGTGPIDLGLDLK